MFRKASTTPAVEKPFGAGSSAVLDEGRRERLVRLLAPETFLAFFQAYMVAPLTPRHSAAFGVSAQTIGLIVPTPRP